MKRAIVVLIFLVWGMTQGARFCPAANSQGETDAEPEDYQLLRDIITTEFSGQTPHEWGQSVAGVKTRLKTENKAIALGVNACDLMDAGQDAKLIKSLAAENIPATLFICGEWIDKHSTVLKKLAANPLFEIANQGVSRKACSVNGKAADGVSGTGSVEELFSEIEHNARKIESITGILPQYYYPETGYYDEVAVRIVRALGYEPLGSSTQGPGGMDLGKKQALDLLMNPFAGAIVILGGTSLQGSFVDTVIEKVRKLRLKGYKFVKVSDYPLE